ncbi:MAG: PAS domain S-box protein, partial [Bacteroidota bacterium]
MIPPKVSSLIKEISGFSNWEEFLEKRELLVEEITKLGQENQGLQFKFERSIKEKNILSSVLTKTSLDLTRVSENLKIRAEELSTLLSTIPAYVYFKDINLNYIIVNKSFEKLVGIDLEKIKGTKIQEILPEYHPGSYIEKEVEVIKTGIAFYNIEEEFKKDGLLFWVNSSIAPIFNTTGQIIGLVGISWDITDRKKNEEELLFKNEQLIKADAEKDKFFSIIAHDLRSPFNSLLGFTEMLVDELGTLTL